MFSFLTKNNIDSILKDHMFLLKLSYKKFARFKFFEHDDNFCNRNGRKFEMVKNMLIVIWSELQHAEQILLLIFGEMIRHSFAIDSVLRLHEYDPLEPCNAVHSTYNCPGCSVSNR